MCKFPFSGRGFVAGVESVPYAGYTPTLHWLDSQQCGAQPMRNRRRHTDSPVERLRLAIDCLPMKTREAMLAGVRENDRIIAGAYVDGEGGVCPMLAAHRCGGRTDLLSFAKSWDRFTRTKSGARAVTEREVGILTAQLEDSLMCSCGLDLDVAISEHRELMSRRVRGRRRLADAVDPAGEIKARRLRNRLLGSVLGDNRAGQTDRRPISPVSALG
jgi:hypothetical protein